MLSDRCPVCFVCPVCDVGVLWPNGWADQDETWHTGRPRPWPHYVRWGPSSPSPKGGGQRPPIFGRYLLRPNGCRDQDATWYGHRTQYRRLCVRWGPRSTSQKWGGAPSPIFDPFLLWLNGWMHQDAIWYGGRPHPRRLCVRWRLSLLSKKGAEARSQFLAHVYCGQTAGWIKMPLATAVGVGLRDIVLNGDPAPLP